MVKKINVEIEGTKPLLMNKFGEKALEKLAGRTHTIHSDFKADVEAEDRAYRSANGDLHVPARCIKACITQASAWYKIGRKSFKQYVSGLLKIEPEEVSLGTKKYDIDIQAIPLQRGNRDIRARPIFKNWKLKFTIVYDTPITEDKLHEIVEEAGIRCGLLDRRPAKNGEFGTFKLVKWQPIQ